MYLPLERLRRLWWKYIAAHSITWGSVMSIHAGPCWSVALGINVLPLTCKCIRHVLPRIKALYRTVNSIYFLPYCPPNSVNPAVASSLYCAGWIILCGLYILSRVPDFRVKGGSWTKLCGDFFGMHGTLRMPWGRCTCDFQSSDGRRLTASPNSSSECVCSLKQVT